MSSYLVYTVAAAANPAVGNVVVGFLFPGAAQLHLPTSGGGKRK